MMTSQSQLFKRPVREAEAYLSEHILAQAQAGHSVLVTLLFTLLCSLFTLNSGQVSQLGLQLLRDCWLTHLAGDELLLQILHKAAPGI